MPVIEHGDATIYYETHGEGFPVLTFAPAGLRSVVDVWNDVNSQLREAELAS